MWYNKGMAALVSAIRPGKPDSPLTVVTHEIPWVLHWQDKDTEEKNLIIIKCSPESLITSYFQAGPFDAYPGLPDNIVAAEYGVASNWVADIGPGKPYLADEINDEEVGAVCLVLTHLKAASQYTRAWEDEVPQVRWPKDRFAGLLRYMEPQVAATLL
jgi:hypothetical protein